MRVAQFILLLSVAVFGPLLLVSTGGAQTEKKRLAIQNGSQVSIEYTLLDEQGKKIESNKGKAPFKYTHGQGKIIRGLENGLEGLQVGEQKTIQVKPEDAYGPINAGAFREVPRENLPPGNLKVGTKLIARNGQGRRLPVRVHEIKEKTVVLDLNHPLAGKTLTFEVKVLAIEPAQKE